MATKKTTKPAWYKDVAPERQGHWMAGDHRRHLVTQAGYGERVRVVLRDGTILDGVMGDNKGFWTPDKFAIALRIPGRKTQKWVPVKTIDRVWGDKGRPLTDMLADFIANNRAMA